MAFFQFRRKIDLAKDYSLEEIPVFSALTPTELSLIEKKARLVEFKRGDIVYREGESAEAFYVIISGRFRLSTKSKASAEDETLAYFYRTDHFGETSLLTDKPHSGTIEAKRDGIILKLDKKDFLNLVNDIPAISLHLSRSLGHRLTKKHDDQGKREVKIASLYSRSISPDILPVWLSFAGEINKQTNSPVTLVDFCSHHGDGVSDFFKERKVPTFEFEKMEALSEEDITKCVVTHGDGFDYLYAPTDALEFEKKNEKKISKLITFLAYRYNYILIRLPSAIGHIAFKAMKQSDLVYVATEPYAQDLGEAMEALTEFEQSFGFSKSEIQILSMDRGSEGGHGSGDVIPYEEQEELLGIPIFTPVPNRNEQPERFAGMLRYMAKELAGTLVGLVLGSGAAYGLAHVGVLRVLEEEGIEVDVIAGTSIGAVIAALWAAGYDSKQMEKIALSINKKNGFFKLIGFRDLSIAHHGFIKGNQVKKYIKSFLGDRTFQDLKMPVKIAAVDLFTSDEVVFDTGPVIDAVRASLSVPGIFRPYFYRGKHFIDGGVVDPLPVRILTRAGIKKIIAVNVLAGPRDRQGRNSIRRDQKRRVLKAVEEKRFWQKVFTKSFNKVHNRYAVNIFNVIMRTVQFMEYEISESWADQADVLIHPIVAEGHWAEFYEPKKFIDVGEKHTREQIEAIKKLVAEP